MIREAEVKRAFRIAYDTLAKCDEPKNDADYMLATLNMFQDAWKADGKNELLKYLSIGILEWIGSVATGKEKT